ncbi:MAG: helix-turn-helix transcriptional regulator [Caulobacter sp.]|nr:helix-turn-helix transcriptional regulator [Caulobacter sp.]
MRLVEGLIETAYASVYDPSRWKDLLSQFIAVTGSDMGALHAPPLGAYTPFLFITENIDPTPVLDKVHIYGRQAPFAERAIAMGLVPGVFANADVYPYEELHETDYYREYMHPMDVEHGLQSIYRLNADDGTPAVVMTVNRGRRGDPFNDDDKAVARAAFPHVRRAVGLMLDLQPTKMIDPAIEGALDGFDTACCLIGAGSRLLFANAAARALFGAGVGLSAREDRLNARDPTTDSELHAAIARATDTQVAWSQRAPSEVVIRSAAGGAPVVAIVVPLGHENAFLNVGPIRAAVYLVDASVRQLGLGELTRLRSVYGLTDAEAAITSRLIEGQSVKQIADTRGTSEQTVRTQIKLILEKTQSTRQVDLLRLQRLFAARPDGLSAEQRSATRRSPPRLKS